MGRVLRHRRGQIIRRKDEDGWLWKVGDGSVRERERFEY